MDWCDYSILCPHIMNHSCNIICNTVFQLSHRFGLNSSNNRFHQHLCENTAPISYRSNNGPESEWAGKHVLLINFILCHIYYSWSSSGVQKFTLACQVANSWQCRLCIIETEAECSGRKVFHTVLLFSYIKINHNPVEWFSHLSC